MPDRILILDGHPDSARERFCHALADAYAQGARSVGREVRIVSVADTRFEMLRTAADFAREPESAAILQARADVLWCDHLVIVFPLWLGGAPGLLHGFLEQVARAEFVAGTSGKGIQQKLKGRSARLIVTMGMPAFTYRLLFREHGIRNIMQGVLGFGGVRPARRTLFGMIESSSAEKRAEHLLFVHALGRDGA